MGAEHGDKGLVSKFGEVGVLSRQMGLNYAFSSSVDGNMSKKWAAQWPGQDVDKNRVKFLNENGFDPKKLLAMSPVHGVNMLEVGAGDCVKNELGNADALITKERGVVLSLMSADCGPIVITDKESQVVALVHAGREGVESNIIAKVVNRLGDMGFEPADLVAGVGPMAGCYQMQYISTVQPDLWTEYIQPIGGGDLSLKAEDGRTIIAASNGAEIWVALNLICREQLIRSGVQAENVGVSRECTICGSFVGKSFSHYHSIVDGLPVGRFMTAVALKDNVK